jgi:hypothetical protein
MLIPAAELRGIQKNNPHKVRTADDDISFWCLEPANSPIETAEAIYNIAIEKLGELSRRQKAELSENA